MAKLYVDESYNSTMLIDTLDNYGFDYEIHSADEAKRLGYKKLPLLVVGDKQLDFKKAMRFAKRGE